MADETLNQATGTQGLAVKRSVLRVIGFGIISLGIYGFYWFFVTRKQVTEEVGGKDQVGLQTVGLIVPILNIFILYWLFRDIDKLHRQAGLSGFPALPLAVTPLVISIITRIIPKLSIIGLANLVVYGFVVSKLNEYWDKKTDGKAENAPVTGSEIAVVVGGLVLMILLILAIGAVLLAAIGIANDSGLKELKDTNPGYDY